MTDFIVWRQARGFAILDVERQLCASCLQFESIVNIKYINAKTCETVEKFDAVNGELQALTYNSMLN
jgi:hypothetical protein